MSNCISFLLFLLLDGHRIVSIASAAPMMMGSPPGHWGWNNNNNNINNMGDRVLHCLEEELCFRAFGTRAEDVSEFGNVPPCQQRGWVRCIVRLADHQQAVARTMMKNHNYGPFIMRPKLPAIFTVEQSFPPGRPENNSPSINRQTESSIGRDNNQPFIIVREDNNNPQGRVQQSSFMHQPDAGSFVRDTTRLSASIDQPAGSRQFLFPTTKPIIQQHPSASHPMSDGSKWGGENSVKITQMSISEQTQPSSSARQFDQHNKSLFQFKEPPNSRQDFKQSIPSQLPPPVKQLSFPPFDSDVIQQPVGKQFVNTAVQQPSAPPTQQAAIRVNESPSNSPVRTSFPPIDPAQQRKQFMEPVSPTTPPSQRLNERPKASFQLRFPPFDTTQQPESLNNPKKMMTPARQFPSLPPADRRSQSSPSKDESIEDEGSSFQSLRSASPNQNQPVRSPQQPDIILPPAVNQLISSSEPSPSFRSNQDRSIQESLIRPIEQQLLSRVALKPDEESIPPSAQLDEQTIQQLLAVIRSFSSTTPPSMTDPVLTPIGALPLEPF